MVVRTVGYFGTNFKCHQGVTQGDKLYPTNFNVVTDVVLWHWIMVMSEEEDLPDVVFGTCNV